MASVAGCALSSAGLVRQRAGPSPGRPAGPPAAGGCRLGRRVGPAALKTLNTLNPRGPPGPLHHRHRGVLLRAAEAKAETEEEGGGRVRKLTGEELEVAIAERDRPLVIDFYATWCGPCVLMAKELEQVAAELGDKVRIVKVDTDENPDISTALQIQGLPTIVFVGMDPSKPALRAEGLIPAATVKEIIATEL